MQIHGVFGFVDTAKGTVLIRRRQRHRHQEYMDFLRQIDNNVPPDLDVHVIVDNYATRDLPSRAPEQQRAGKEGFLA